MSFFIRWWDDLKARFAKRTTEGRAATGYRLSGYVALLRRFGADDPRTMTYVGVCSAEDPAFERLWRTASDLYHALAPQTADEKLAALEELVGKYGVESEAVRNFCDVHHKDEEFRLKAFIFRATGRMPGGEEEGESWKRGVPPVA